MQVPQQQMPQQQMPQQQMPQQQMPQQRAPYTPQVAEEKAYYDEIFRMIDVQKQGRLPCPAVANFLQHSGIPRANLSKCLDYFFPAQVRVLQTLPGRY